MQDEHDTDNTLAALAPHTEDFGAAVTIEKPKRKYTKRRKKRLTKRIPKAESVVPSTASNPATSAPTANGSAPAALSPETAGVHPFDRAARYIATRFRAPSPEPVAARLAEDGALLIEPNYSPRIIVALGMAGTAAIVVVGWFLAWNWW